MELVARRRAVSFIYNGSGLLFTSFEDVVLLVAGLSAALRVVCPIAWRANGPSAALMCTCRWPVQSFSGRMGCWRCLLMLVIRNSIKSKKKSVLPPVTLINARRRSLAGHHCWSREANWQCLRLLQISETRRAQPLPYSCVAEAFPASTGSAAAADAGSSPTNCDVLPSASPSCGTAFISIGVASVSPADLM